MNKLQKFGGFSALYLAAAYVIGLVLFIFVLNYPSITDPMQKVAVLVAQPGVIYATNVIMYEVFGIGLILLVMALHDRLGASNPQLMRVASAIGVVWAGLLIASGVVANAGIAPVLNLYATDPSQAALTWQGIETIANGLSSANGELLGGLLVLLVSVAGFQSRLLPKGFNWLGVAVGAVGLISVIPGLHDLTAVFGLTQIVWFIWLAVVLLRKQA